MTLAIGVRCGEGTVLLSDGLAIGIRDGVAESVAACKIDRLDGAKLAFIRSGPACRPLCDFPPAVDFRTNARWLFRQVQANHVTVPAGVLATARTLDGGAISTADAEAVLNAHDLVVASTIGGRQLALLTDSDEQWVDGDGAVVGGAAREWWAEQSKPAAPTTLALCLLLALQVAARFRRYCYTEVDYLADRGLSDTRTAPIGGPLHGLTITNESVRYWTMGAAS